MAETDGSKWNRLGPVMLRQLIILVVIIVGAGVALAVSQLRNDPYAGARLATDTFLKAYENCDFNTAKHYYTPFQTNTETANLYKQQCTKGAINFTFSRQINTSSTTSKGTTTKSVFLEYSVSGKGGVVSKVVITTASIDNGKQWRITAVNAEPITSPAQPSGK